MNPTLWFPFHGSISHPKIRLFCFSHSGGVASNFRTWQNYFSPHIEISPLQLPGREARFKEPFILSISTLIDELWPHILMQFNIPIAFFGSSLGALIAYELVKKARRECIDIPMMLFVSACLPPHCLEMHTSISQLPDKEFMHHVQEYGGIPQQLLNDPATLEVIIPRLKADFTLFETYQEYSFSPLDIPLIAFGGIDDRTVPTKNLQEWARYTTKYFTAHLFVGGHFYHFMAIKDLSKILAKYLTYFIS